MLYARFNSAVDHPISEHYIDLQAGLYWWPTPFNGAARRGGVALAATRPRRRACCREFLLRAAILGAHFASFSKLAGQSNRLAPQWNPETARKDA